MFSEWNQVIHIGLVFFFMERQVLNMMSFFSLSPHNTSHISVWSNYQTSAREKFHAQHFETGTGFENLISICPGLIFFFLSESPLPLLTRCFFPHLISGSTFVISPPTHLHYPSPPLAAVPQRVGLSMGKRAERRYQGNTSWGGPLTCSGKTATLQKLQFKLSVPCKACSPNF